ncbi:hypothetical protein CVT26_015076 [Gymnopilus dilepis]|uniref:Uncharacterized protein n=1 Tax=Gymnopilus dilepis TaxID=231916 RepID=A0A409WQU8_9AGAR|nr:hypothetical protein CVT26_015076 [Gymnopilus dilepis]
MSDVLLMNCALSLPFSAKLQRITYDDRHTRARGTLRRSILLKQSLFEREATETLFHKRPFHTTWEDDGPPLEAVDPLFDFENLLKCLSPTDTSPSSPLSAPATFSATDDEDLNLFSLSPLSSGGWSDAELEEEFSALPPSLLGVPYLPSSPDNGVPSSTAVATAQAREIDHDNAVTSSASRPSSPAPRRHLSQGGQEMAEASVAEGGSSHKGRRGALNHQRRKEKRRRKREEESSNREARSDAQKEIAPPKGRRGTLNHQRRREKRQREREEEFSHHEARSNAQKESAPPIYVDLATEKCSTTSAAFVGLNDTSGAKKVFNLDELIGEGAKRKFGYVSWDGNLRRSVTDVRGRKVAFLAGRPADKDWPQLMHEAADALETNRSRLSIPKEERVHRRGAFPAVPCGISHGGGSTQPGNLHNNKDNAAVVEDLCAMECFKRLAGFATFYDSAVMASKAPKLYHYYVEHLAKLHEKHPGLKRLFPSSVFAAASFNFGPRTACRKHKDFANLPFGLCAVTALGNFDPQKGGHLVLWECGLVIEFPPGSTILLPSAIIAHSNTSIQNHEKRYSFSQYTAGGLFRWVEHDFQLAADYYASLSTEDLNTARQKDAERWQYGLSLFEQVHPDI